MTLAWYAARAQLSWLQQQHPDWTPAQFAAVLGYSPGWVKKWLKRLRDAQAAGIPVEQTVQGHARARKHLPAKTHPLVGEQILAIRDQPPEGLRRVPGQEAIRYYRQRDPARALFQLPVPSCKTIYRVLKRHQRIVERGKPFHEPLARPKPMSVWQLDFKDVSSVPADPADPSGTQRQVVETLNILDTGTSILLDAHVRSAFTAETALQALASTLVKYGSPHRLTLARDPRWVGSPAGSDFPAALLRFGACLGIGIEVCDPHHPAHHGFVERYHRPYQHECLALDRPTTLEQAKAVTAAFVRHSNLERPHQGLSCANRPPLIAFPHLPVLPALPMRVDPDRWLTALDGLHGQRQVDRYGMISIDLKRYSVSTQLVGHHVAVRLDAQQRCLQVLHEQQPFKSVPLRGLVGQPLSCEQFLTHMRHQARAQARLRSLQERKFRTAAVASP